MLTFPIRRLGSRLPPLSSRLLLYLCCFGILITQVSSCASPFNGTKMTTVNFNLVNVFTTCHNPTSSTGIIPYRIIMYLYTYINNNSNGALTMYDDVTANSASTPSSSITLQAPVYHDGTPYAFKIIVTGIDCARCAITQNCPQIANGNNTAFSAGIPQWEYFSGPQSGAQTFLISNWTPFDNWSCGCSVPN